MILGKYSGKALMWVFSTGNTDDLQKQNSYFKQTSYLLVNFFHGLTDLLFLLMELKNLDWLL